MLDAMRTQEHRDTLITERLKQGVYPYQPFGAAPTLAKAPTLIPGAVADADPLATFLLSAIRELRLLDRYGDEASSTIQWSLRHLMQATRPESLLGSFEYLTGRNAMIFPSLGFAISPPSDWQVIPLDGVTTAVTSNDSYEHILPDKLVLPTPGEPIGVVHSIGKATIHMTFSELKTMRILFLPLYPVVDATLKIGTISFLPMKTERGLYFWLGEQKSTNFELELSLSGRACMIGSPLIADGKWEQAGEVSAELSHILSPIMLKATSSGAIFAIRTANIQGWTEVPTGKAVPLPVTMKTQISFPVSNTITIPAGFVPQKLYRGYRSWYLDSYTKDQDNNWLRTSSEYAPLEGTNFNLTAAQMVKLRTYLHADRELVLSVTVSGEVAVNGVVQPSGQITIPTGDCELSITLNQGSHGFFVPIPPEVSMRARYTMPRYQLTGASVVMENAPNVPHELILVSDARSILQVRAGLPVTQGRPAVVADLQVS